MLDCADVGHLVFLPSGDAALTRRATRFSGLSAVVVRWSSSRKRCERQGIPAEAEAIECAERSAYPMLRLEPAVATTPSLVTALSISTAWPGRITDGAGGAA